MRRNPLQRSQRMCASSIELPLRDQLIFSAASGYAHVPVAQCRPAGGTSPPCLRESFFHVPQAALEAHTINMSALPPRIGDRTTYEQCRRRSSDSEWPTFEPHARRARGTKTLADVLKLLRGRRVTLVGASLMQQTHHAIQCAAASANARPRQFRFVHGGTATLSNRILPNSIDACMQYSCVHASFMCTLHMPSHTQWHACVLRTVRPVASRASRLPP
jgi:hypothetical protein